LNCLSGLRLPEAIMTLRGVTENYAKLSNTLDISGRKNNNIQLI